MVTKYCDQRNNGIDPEAFIDHYIANGWMVGKTKMKDWQASIRTWEAKRKPEKPKANGAYDPNKKFRKADLVL
jgi:hypothetical protein